MNADDKAREECGVVAIRIDSDTASHDAARAAFYALFALQHRGQESAGIAATDGQADVHPQGAGPRDARVRGG